MKRPFNKPPGSKFTAKGQVGERAPVAAVKAGAGAMAEGAVANRRGKGKMDGDRVLAETSVKHYEFGRQE